MLAAVLTVSGPWLPARWRHWWWGLLLAFIPIHLVVSAIVPARSLLGLAVGWFVGALVILVSGTPALEVPLDDAVRAMAKRGFVVNGLRVVRPAGSGPLILAAVTEEPEENAVVEMYGPHQRSGGALRQVWRILRLRENETAPLQASMRRAVEHRALMAIAIGDLGIANTETIAVGTLDRGWTLVRAQAYSRRAAEEVPRVDAGRRSVGIAAQVAGPSDLARRSARQGDHRQQWRGVLRRLRQRGIRRHRQSAAGRHRPTVGDDVGAVRRGRGRRRGDRGARAGHRADRVAPAHQNRCAETYPRLGRRRQSRHLPKPRGGHAPNRHGEDQTRVSHPVQPQPACPVGVARSRWSTSPTRSSARCRRSSTRCPTPTGGGRLLGLAISASTYVGAAAALWASADESVNFWRLSIAQVANTFAATTTPAGVGGLALSTRILQKSGLSTTRATTAVALQQSMQVIMHVVLLIFFSTAAGAGTDLSHFVPNSTVLYLIAGAALGIVGVFLLVPNLRRWLSTSVTPRLKEIITDIIEVAREPKRMGLIVLGCTGTTLGAALALWSSVEAFGGHATFVTVTVVTMVGGTLASAAPTPGGVGAVEAALIGGLAAFGIPAAVSVPSVLLYRVLTCWLPVFIGWPVMQWLTRNDMV